MAVSGGKRILVVGGGAREHALAWKIARSPEVSQVIAVPGNAGINLEPRASAVRIANADMRGLILRLVAFAKGQEISWTAVGPETFLAAGIVDEFERHGLRAFGPAREAARLETSKCWAKRFLCRHGIPTAAAEIFECGPDSERAAYEHIEKSSLPVVVKQDGLAAGKGVIVAETRKEAEQAAKAWLSAGPILIEEFLGGEEVSFTCIVSGKDVVPLETAQDHKRRFAGNRTPNPMTGGMGAVSPAPCMNDALFRRIMDEIVHPTIEGLSEEGISYVGFLYFGLMIAPNGPKVLEYNCRLGDPEAQVLLPRLRTDLAPVLESAMQRGLRYAHPLVWDGRTAVGVVLCDEQYPGQGEAGLRIAGALGVPDTGSCKVFHASTRFEHKRLVTDGGGRVLSVVGLGNDLAEARERAYARAGQIHWPRKSCRPDIGLPLKHLPALKRT